MRKFYNIKMKFVKVLITCLILAIINSTSLKRKGDGNLHSPCTADHKKCKKNLWCCPDLTRPPAYQCSDIDAITGCTKGTIE